MHDRHDRRPVRRRTRRTAKANAGGSPITILKQYKRMTDERFSSRPSLLWDEMPPCAKGQAPSPKAALKAAFGDFFGGKGEERSFAELDRQTFASQVRPDPDFSVAAAAAQTFGRKAYDLIERCVRLRTDLRLFCRRCIA